MAAKKRKEFGDYVVSDPEICGGALTFKGTRILVKDVLYFVARGKDWNWISAQCFHRVSSEAIAEAVDLATQALTKTTEQRQRAA